MSGRLFRTVCRCRSTNCVIVRHTSKSTKKRVPEVKTFLLRESEKIFGPTRTMNSSLKKHNGTTKVDDNAYQKVKSSIQTSNNPTRNASGVVTTVQQIDDLAEQTQDRPRKGRSSVARKLDSILTFPLGKEDRDNSLDLIPSVNEDISILKTELVTSLEKKLSLPSVSKVLEISRPPEQQAMLDRWKRRMISELGEDGFAAWQKETFARGNNLHSCIQKQLETGDGESDLVGKNMPFWESVQHVFDGLSDIQMVEKYCKHPHLRYHGYFDCVARYRDKLCLIEWKTSKRQKATIDSTFDNPIQVAAYIGAVNFDDRYDLNLDDGLIVVAYENGEPADVHPMKRSQSQHYWGSWLHRVYTYWKITLHEQEQEGENSVSRQYGHQV